MVRTRDAESLTIRRALGDRKGVAASLGNMGNVAREQGEYAAARAYAQGEHPRAAQLFGAAEVTREAIGAPLSPIEAVEYERNVAALRAGCDRELFTAAWAEGRAMPLEQAVTLGARADP